MDFRAKALAQNWLSIMPGKWGLDINYLLQRYVTHSWPLNFEQFKKYYKTKVESHWSAYKKFSGRQSLEGIHYFEFGAGWDLLAPLGFSLLGIKELYVVDIEPVVRIELINETIDLYSTMKEKSYGHISSLRDLCEKYHISYEAPCDAASTNMLDGSIDFIVTNVVLEHIPVVSIPGILRECYRVLSPDGILSFKINYGDHYSYFDSSISIYNYLKYGKNEWNKYNCALHYQNRLRHNDYRRLLSDAGFRILQEESYSPEDVSALEHLPIHEDFGSYTMEELKPTGGWFVATK